MSDQDPRQSLLTDAEELVTTDGDSRPDSTLKTILLNSEIESINRRLSAIENQVTRDRKLSIKEVSISIVVFGLMVLLAIVLPKMSSKLQGLTKKYNKLSSQYESLDNDVQADIDALEGVVVDANNDIDILRRLLGYSSSNITELSDLLRKTDKSVLSGYFPVTTSDQKGNTVGSITSLNGTYLVYCQVVGDSQSVSDVNAYTNCNFGTSIKLGFNTSYAIDVGSYHVRSDSNIRILDIEPDDVLNFYMNHVCISSCFVAEYYYMVVKLRP